MRYLKLSLGVFLFLGAAYSIFWVLQDEHTLLTHPKGIIAQNELKLIKDQILLMLLLVIPTFLLLFAVIWKYRSKNKKKGHEPQHCASSLSELLLWAIPSFVIAAMAIILWDAAHELDPYKPLASEKKTLTIQVVALDWKWLFIYPEQEIACVNFVQFPEKTPIHFVLSADGSPMNSFWIPELSGQIYAMTAMTTPLHLMADAPGEYRGRAAEINGKGFAGMTFVAKSTTQSDFDDWVQFVKKSPLQLTDSAYATLLAPSPDHPVTFYSQVSKKLFHQIVMKPMHPHL